MWSRLVKVNDERSYVFIANLERQEAELNDEIAQLEADIENGAGDVSELRCCIASLEAQLESTGQKLADKRDKLKLADRQLAELQDELSSSGLRPHGRSEEAPPPPHDWAN